MHVLVVEDDPTISRFLVRGLREEHYVVDLAEDSETAERLAADGPYDAIVLDVLLPGIDGFELCRRFRRDGILQPHPTLRGLCRLSRLVLAHRAIS